MPIYRMRGRPLPPNQIEAGRSSTATPPPQPVVPTPPVGVVASVRPKVRPDGLQGRAQGTKAAFGTLSVPVGTRMAQLGAFNTLAIAETEWIRLRTRHRALFGDRKPVVQQIERGGRALYRLRAHGFADAAATRRFCTALLERGESCFPVVMN